MSKEDALRRGIILKCDQCGSRDICNANPGSPFSGFHYCEGAGCDAIICCICASLSGCPMSLCKLHLAEKVLTNDLG